MLKMQPPNKDKSQGKLKRFFFNIESVSLHVKLQEITPKVCFLGVHLSASSFRKTRDIVSLPKLN